MRGSTGSPVKDICFPTQFREDDQPSDLCTQIHGESAEQRDHARERVTMRLVDDSEKDGHGTTIHEDFDVFRCFGVWCSAMREIKRVVLDGLWGWRCCTVPWYLREPG